MIRSFLLCIGLLAAAQEPPAPSGVPVFTSGQGGYHTYRIPALAVTKKGTLLAFCEGRKQGWGDAGDIDLLLRRSTDGGRTWGPTQVVWDDGDHTCGNPCIVEDEKSGTLWLLSTWNRGDDHESQIIAQTSKDTRRVFIQSSRDEGRTWSQPREITDSVKQPAWTWYATGPGSGIQIQRGPHKGRLVIPCDHIEAGSRHYGSHVIHSDDHGKTWTLGGSTPGHQVNECEVAELEGGRLMLNIRNYDDTAKARQVAVSEDGGATWKDQRIDPQLVEPRCQAAIERLRWPSKGKPGVLLFSNPSHPSKRVQLTVRASLDDGGTWPLSRVLFTGPSGYSDLAMLKDGRIGCLFEAGPRNLAEGIVFEAFPLERLTRSE